MNNIQYYTELLQTLTARLIEVENENASLLVKLSNYEGKFEILNQFYSDFKFLNRTDLILPDENTQSTTKPTYSSLLSEYFLTKNSEIIERLFSDCDVPASRILTDIRATLPNNIESIVEKFKCRQEYGIIQKSIQNINKLMEKKSHSERGILDLVDYYITNHNKGKKRIALKFLQQALVYFPFQFNIFLDSIKEYYYDDLDEQIEAMKIELYGENNMLLTGGSILSKKVKTQSKTINTKKKYIRVDYLNTPVNELVMLVNGLKNNPRQKAMHIKEVLLKTGKHDDKCISFIEEINKYLTIKIEI
jgi:hypothetical protein